MAGLKLNRRVVAPFFYLGEVAFNLWAAFLVIKAFILCLLQIILLVANYLFIAEDPWLTGYYFRKKNRVFMRDGLRDHNYLNYAF